MIYKRASLSRLSRQTPSVVSRLNSSRPKGFMPKGARFESPPPRGGWIGHAFLPN